MRVIMVPVADRPECAVALDGAFSLAERLEANVRATHIRPHRYSRVTLPEETSFLLAPADMPELSVAEQDTAEAASRAARALVEKVAAARGFSATGKLDGSSTRSLVWQEDVGNIANLMPVIGPFADLIAVSRPQKAGSRVARAFVEQSLLSTGRPVLVLPPRRRYQPGRRVVIGWDRTLNAMRSIVAALPILARAESVSILVSGNGKSGGPKVSNLAKYLKAWGVNATKKQVRGAGTDPVSDLTDHCKDVGADLLVIGAYSRSRMRQLVFGGVTQHFLTTTDLPVLMTHG